MDKNKKYGRFQLSKIVNNANLCTTNKWLLISALPGGYRNNNGTFNNLGNNGYWWSSAENSSTNAWKRNMNYNNGNVNRNNNNKTNGFSVRCLRDLLNYCS
ncbi:MAG: fibrobacter succinogenes major paralogous domain-containing protein [Bacteroidales bacterium]|nr:fibrobacter succinogenes major paralogous domain-containing protein [Bacteroidales bacterium]